MWGRQTQLNVAGLFYLAFFLCLIFFLILSFSVRFLLNFILEYWNDNKSIFIFLSYKKLI
jgi:hypothetical protein